MGPAPNARIERSGAFDEGGRHAHQWRSRAAASARECTPSLPSTTLGMMAGGMRAYAEPLREHVVREALSEQSRYLHFALGQAEGVLKPQHRLGLRRGSALDHLTHPLPQGRQGVDLLTKLRHQGVSLHAQLLPDGLELWQARCVLRCRVMIPRHRGGQFGVHCCNLRHLE